MAYSYTEFPYCKPLELTGGSSDAPIAIIGAGPVGLALAIDLAQRGVKSVVLDDNNIVSVGSRAICWAKRTLEIFARLGIGEKMLEKGVTWKIGRLFHGSKEVYAFDLLPEEGHQYPAFLNLQQYYVEEYLVQRCHDFPDLIDLRFLNTVTSHHDLGDRVELTVETPDGTYRLDVTYVVACDGANSPTRERMELAFEGQTFEEQFLIADIEMEDSPFGHKDVPERWFWFDPPFHQGRSALLHMQPDSIYRIDLQLDADADGKAEAAEDKVLPRIKAIVGEKPFKLDWVSVYRFGCIRLEKFVHGRVIFAGDSAHVVSPFGARGGNGGVQDVDNLGWKLAAIVQGEAGPGLLHSYEDERGHGADENIKNSSRATSFMTPKTPVEALFRREALRLAYDHTFARKMLNSGRLSMPCSLDKLPLQTPADEGVGLAPGSPMLDAPIVGAHGDDVWLIGSMPQGFTLLGFGDVSLPDIDGVQSMLVARPDAAVLDRYGHDVVYLIRPDQHVAARFGANPSPAAIEAARARALGHAPDLQVAAA
ncbi:MAG: FAD-dependent monooxygenase [Pseudomonadota bacterium]